MKIDEFKEATRNAIQATRIDIEGIGAIVEDLPNTISITTSQVFRVRDENDTENGDGGPICLDGIIQEQYDAIIAHENCLEVHSEKMKKMEKHTDKEIHRVMDWVTQQKQDEKDEMKTLKDTMERIEIDLNGKMSYVDVEEKISVKVRELVDQIKDALLAVEEDEADFKNVANALHGLFNSLKESKADKSEMAQLRNQLINSQMNQPESKDGVMDYKGLRKILSSYCKTEKIDKQLDGKANKVLTFQRLDHTENMIDNILGTIDELWRATRRNSESPTNNNYFSSKDIGGLSGWNLEEDINGAGEMSSENGSGLNSQAQILSPIKEESGSKKYMPKISPNTTIKTNRRKSFDLGRESQPIVDRLASQHNRPKTAATLQSSYVRSSVSHNDVVSVKHRPHTSPGNPMFHSTSISKRLMPTPKGPYRKLSMPNKNEFQKIQRDSRKNEVDLRPLPAIESKHMVPDVDGKLFVSNCKNKPVIRDSSEMRLRRMSCFEGRATGYL